MSHAAVCLNRVVSESGGGDQAEVWCSVEGVANTSSLSPPTCQRLGLHVLLTPAT